MKAADLPFDVLVVGAGPAGWSAAIAVADKGLRVAVADRGCAPQPCGETLAPAGATVLRSLGVWDEFRAGPHLPCYGYRAVWGSASTTVFDLLRSPGGPAWMVDRCSLVAVLRSRALRCGATWLRFAGAVAAERRAQLWRVRLGLTHPPLVARQIVDASGRAGVIARKTGARHLAENRQIAFVSILAVNDCHDATVLVEAAPDGWWYSARAPSGRLVFAYFSDRDLIDIRAAREWSGFMSLLKRTGATAERMRSVGSALEGGIRVVAAYDGAMDQVAGDGWVAAGDAAFAYDPLSGHGITAALASGRDAGRAVAAATTGDAAALPQYAARLLHAHSRYRTRRGQQYAAEGRWSERPFWARRTFPKISPNSECTPFRQTD
jgi:flavin-dependent dehydrogenase